jgi:hypothetical protein
MVEKKEVISCHEVAFIESFIQRELQKRFKGVFTKNRWRQSKDRKKRLKWARLLIEFEHWVDSRRVNSVPLSYPNRPRKKRKVILKKWELLEIVMQYLKRKSWMVG